MLGSEEVQNHLFFLILFEVEGDEGFFFVDLVDEREGEGEGGEGSTPSEEEGGDEGVMELGDGDGGGEEAAKFFAFEEAVDGGPEDEGAFEGCAGVEDVGVGGLGEVFGDGAEELEGGADDVDGGVVFDPGTRSANQERKEMKLARLKVSELAIDVAEEDDGEEGRGEGWEGGGGEGFATEGEGAVEDAGEVFKDLDIKCG